MHTIYNAPHTSKTKTLADGGTVEMTFRPHMVAQYILTFRTFNPLSPSPRIYEYSCKEDAEKAFEEAEFYSHR